MDANELRRLVERYSLKHLESCIEQQLAKGENACDVVDATDAVIAELSRATVVRELMDTGMRFSEALRELGKRIRAIYRKDQDAP